jgi:hypothetical protein
MKTTILFFFAAMSTAFADAIVKVDGPGTQPVVGQTFAVHVDIVGVTDLAFWQTDLNYDPAELSVVSVDEGPFLQTAGTTSFVPGTDHPAMGVITSIADALFGTGPGASGSGTLVTVDFKALRAGPTSLYVSNVILGDSNGMDINFTTAPGTVTPTPTPEPAAVSQVLLSILLLLVMWRRPLSSR